MVGRIKDVLDIDLTSDDNVPKLEDFKKSANAYGECSLHQALFSSSHSNFNTNQTL